MARNTIFAQKEITIQSEEVTVLVGDGLNAFSINGESVATFNGFTANSTLASVSAISFADSAPPTPVVLTAVPGSPPWITTVAGKLHLDLGMYLVLAQIVVTNAANLFLGFQTDTTPSTGVRSFFFESANALTPPNGDVRGGTLPLVSGNLPFDLGLEVTGTATAAGNVNIVSGFLQIFKIF